MDMFLVITYVSKMVKDFVKELLLILKWPSSNHGPAQSSCQNYTSNSQVHHLIFTI